jgi:hypothetical protein
MLISLWSQRLTKDYTDQLAHTVQQRVSKVRYGSKGLLASRRIATSFKGHIGVIKVN